MCKFYISNLEQLTKHDLQLNYINFQFNYDVISTTKI